MTQQLNLNPNIADADGFYEALVGAQRSMSDEAAQAFIAKLVLILANHVGDAAVLKQAIELAAQD